MKIPIIQGCIDRRILVNYRVDADRLSAFLPAPFRPQLVNGFGIAGICLIRLKQLRPRGLPGVLGVGSENAAHRIAVEWDVDGQTQTGVYITRRDTSSRINTWVGGRLFPGEHHHAHFDVTETGNSFRVAMRSKDDSTNLAVEAALASELPENSAFESLDEASDFFECGSLGYSPNCRTKSFDGLELRTFNWQAEPLAVSRVESSLFDDQQVFPPGTAEFDHALLMRDIDHQWHSRTSIPAARNSAEEV